MQLTCVCWGLGSWLVALGVKATPAAWVEKIPIQMNEDAVDDNDPVMKSFMSATQTKGIKRSETERLIMDFK